MGILKKTLAIFILISISILSLNAQNRATAFATSYTYETSGQYTKAIQEIIKVYDKNNYPINLRLGWLNYLKGDFTASVSYYKQASVLMPYSVEARLGLVYPAYSMGNTNLVISTYKKIIEIDSKNYTANYKIAIIYNGKKNYKEAYMHLQTIVNLYPFDYNTTILFAWVNLNLGKTKEAKILFNKALLLSPNDVSAKKGLESIK